MLHCGIRITALPAPGVLRGRLRDYVLLDSFQSAQGTSIMTIIRALLGRFRPAAPALGTIAIGNMTDVQLRRTGLSKAEMLHRTFSGLMTCG